MKERWVIGIDEVGRGPLAGPVTLAAVAARVRNHESRIMNYGLEGIRDSKKLSPKQRSEWNTIIKQSYIYSVCSIPARFIDKKGIVAATRMAVSRCLKKLDCSMLHASCSMIFLDGGLYAPPEYKNQQTIITGDEKVPLIAAASIIAKVHRDRYMTRLHKKYPLYGFDKHKGYGTVMHREAILRHGLSEVHRASFCKNLVSR